MTYRDQRFTPAMAQDAFEEGKHPRDHGKFSKGAGGAGKSTITKSGPPQMVTKSEQTGSAQAAKLDRMAVPSLEKSDPKLFEEGVRESVHGDHEGFSKSENRVINKFIGQTGGTHVGITKAVRDGLHGFSPKEKASLTGFIDDIRLYAHSAR